MKRIIQYYRQIFSQEFIDRTISGGIKGQVKLLIAVIIGVLLIASITVIGLHIELIPNSEWHEQIWILYNNFVDPGNQSSQEGWLNRLMAGIISLLGSILLGGVLISTISNIIERRVEAIRTGRVCYTSIKNHYVIIGYSNVTVSLIKELTHEDPNANIIIMSSQASENVRHNLQAQLDKKEEQHVYVYFGNIESLEELARLNIQHAKEVYILGEEGDYGRDSKNIQCVHRVSLLKGQTPEGHELPVYTQFDQLASYGVIQKLTLISHKTPNCASATNTLKQSTNIYFRPFNLHENWARRLWSIYGIEPVRTYDALDYDPIRFLADGSIHNQDKYVHLVIAGFGCMGQALLLEALRICHYANYDDQQDDTLRVRTLITILDKNMEVLKNRFTMQFPHLDTQIDDIRIDYRNEDLSNPSIRKDLQQWSKDPHQLLTVAICISNPDESIILGLNLPEEIYESQTRVLIRQEIQTDLGQIIHEDKSRYRHVKVFGMLEQSISKKILRDEIPCYVNQQYDDYYNQKCGQKNFIKHLYQYWQNNKTAEFETERNRAFRTWINLEENMRWANRYQIDAYLIYLSTLGYKVTYALEEGETEITPQKFENNLKKREHEIQVLMRMEKHRWNAERTIEGWRYGSKRNDVHRIHPLIVPFNQISKKDKTKDRQVIDNLPYLMSMSQYKITKTSSMKR